MRQNLVVFVSFLAVVSALVAQGQPDRPVPSVQEVRTILNDQQPDPGNRLRLFGERLHPAFEAILNDRTVSDHEALLIFLVVRGQTGDRTRFAPHAVRWLADARARGPAIALLTEIGSRQHTPPLVALLWDPSADIVRAALKALESLGGERELAAVEIWIKAKTDELRAAEQVRDALRQRAEGENKKGR